MSNHQDVKLTADVLVLGGGPAGAWAAWSAASQGAKVVLADKGYLGSSGATAPGGTTLLVIPAVPELREEAVQTRLRDGGYLSETEWIYRVLEQIEQNLTLIEEWGYPFPKDLDGTTLRTHLHGPEYMKLMRKVVRKAGVTILDQSPALELLVDEHGVGGARGVNRITGADLSGMEFSRQYAPSFADGSVTRGRMLAWSSLYDKNGERIRSGERTPGSMQKLLLEGPVYASLDLADTEEKRQFLRNAHPIFFMPLERAGIDPFRDKFPLTLRYEGTMRGTGGIRITTSDCATAVPGLYAVGDAASREKVMGAVSGGGSYNASWAICSGTWAGEGAAAYALANSRKADTRSLLPAGRYGLTSTQSEQKSELSIKQMISSIQKEVLPLEINFFRSEPVIRESLARLHSLFPSLNGLTTSTVQERVKSRESAGMLAAARWMYTAALVRKETRGLQALKEYPEIDPLQTHRIILSGIDDIRQSVEHAPHAHEMLPAKEGQSS